MFDIPRWPLLLAALVPVLTGCAEDVALAEESVEPIAMRVFKSPTCGCCNDWIEHVNANGFSAEGVHPYDLDETRALLGVREVYQSCHTGLTEEGHIFEGHVPARLIRQFLDEKPADAIGLAVPGMPRGSPGMEMGSKFDPYQVLLLMKDGSYRVYARIDDPDQQY